ncbi:hypothetical protein FOA52_015164 [Chlamydomonas sp. UWO 241]|nr:hypothetical protein FOA52_015164 [Chlamydomonas sp. UWO 241]
MEHLPDIRGRARDTRARWGKATLMAASVELIGAALFQIIAASTSTPLAVASTFAAVQYATKYLSGGHLNPAVSLAAAGSGHMRWSTGGLYALVQVIGALLGALLQAFLIPSSHIGHESAGCISPGSDVSSYQLFGWELLLCFLFVMVQYAALFVRPGHGDAAPLASAVALYAILASVGNLTGGSPVNPARTIASSLVFNCHTYAAWVYLAGQLAAAALAACCAVMWHGTGPYYGSNERHESGEGGGLLAGLAPGGESGGDRDATFAPCGKL